MLNFWRWTIALLFLIPLSVAQLRRHRTLLLQQWKLILALGATGVAAMGPTKAGMFTYFMPVFGAVLAVLFLSGPIALYHVLGAVSVFAGIAITNRGFAHARGHVPPCV